MDIASITADLEREWDFDIGYFGRLRRGEFDAACLNRLLHVLNQIELQDENMVNRRVVSLIWYMPLFMAWQRDRVQHGDMVQFDKATNQIQNLVERILGVP